MDTTTMNTTTNHGAVIPLLPTEPASATPLTDEQSIYRVIGGLETVELSFAEELEKKLTVAQQSLQRCSEAHASLGARMRERIAELEVRLAAYEYKMLRLAARRSRSMPEDKSLWPDIMYSSYADLLAEFEDYKYAMSAYLGDSRVLEAITQYEINNRHTN